MADKSVIQTTMEECDIAKQQALVANQNYQAFARPELMRGDALEHMNDGFGMGWDMCLAYILHHGNCKFEK